MSVTYNEYIQYPVEYTYNKCEKSMVYIGDPCRWYGGLGASNENILKYILYVTLVSALGPRSNLDWFYEYIFMMKVF